VLLTGIGWLSFRMAPRLAAPATSAAPAERAPAVLARLAPFITVAVAAFVPLAAGLYLLTTTAWTLGERTILRRAQGSRREPNRGKRRARIRGQHLEPPAGT